MRELGPKSHEYVLAQIPLAWDAGGRIIKWKGTGGARTGRERHRGRGIVQPAVSRGLVLHRYLGTAI